MTDITLAPNSVTDLADAIRASTRVVLVGAGTKPRLSQAEGTRITTTTLRGIVEYDPSEYTITALAGTPVREVSAALAARGQYLPFDPPLANAGATLGGTVAAGLSGPGRFRFGGLRDFILGVRFVDGDGRVLRAGGKVVKNAAGFDLPKFFVGSLGRFGALAEVTFKVFPRPPAQRTIELQVEKDTEFAQRFAAAGNTRWEIDALDGAGDGRRLFLRLAANPAALDALVREILARWPGRELGEAEANQYWDDGGEFRWAHHGGVWLKVVTTTTQLPAALPALRSIPGARLRVSAGGNLALLSLPDATHVNDVSEQLRALRLPALTLRGDAPLFPAGRENTELEARIKSALDPANRFPNLEP